MTRDQIAGWVLFTFVISITPGPNNIMVLASGLNFGFRRTLPHQFGIALGTVAMLVAVGLGFGAVFVAWPRLYDALRAVSIAYTLWLAWSIARSGVMPADRDAGAGRPMTLLEAALFQWVNPKAWTIAATGMAAYAAPESLVASLAIMSLVLFVVNLPSVSVWTLSGAGLGRVFADPVKVRTFNLVMAALLVASIYPFVVGLLR